MGFGAVCVCAMQDAVVDLAWSPTHATVFATATRDGWLQIWDLRVSQYVAPSSSLAICSPLGCMGLNTDTASFALACRIKPVVDLKHAVSTTAVQFGPTSPSVVLGNDSGQVIVYKLAGLTPAPDTTEVRPSLSRCMVCKTRWFVCV